MYTLTLHGAGQRLLFTSVKQNQ